MSGIFEGRHQHSVYLVHAHTLHIGLHALPHVGHIGVALQIVLYALAHYVAGIGHTAHAAQCVEVGQQCQMYGRSDHGAAQRCTHHSALRQVAGHGQRVGHHDVSGKCAGGVPRIFNSSYHKAVSLSHAEQCGMTEADRLSLAAVGGGSAARCKQQRGYKYIKIFHRCYVLGQYGAHYPHISTSANSTSISASASSASITPLFRLQYWYSSV